MGIKVDPNQVDKLGSHYKRLSKIIDEREMYLHREINNVIKSTFAHYHEWYVRNTAHEIERLLKETRMLAKSITEELHRQSRVLQEVATRYRLDEEEAKKRSKAKNSFIFSKVQNKIIRVPTNKSEIILNKNKALILNILAMPSNFRGT